MLAKLAQEIVNITSEVIGMMYLSRIKTEWFLVQAISREILVGGTPQSVRTIETLGLSKLSKEEIKDFVRTGRPKVSA
ncbi:hypothetical protein OCO53_26645 [Peribacillus frigoritolerans]|uniref:hypothetical protein n=1 Tax=Peribacillus frigoritolerans TaxID=450367 RepID=UPI0021D1782F|nr:hypothetical protein [Peribacillus frigoritolerans]MCU6604017.1 hypothetical protein [Peribacillus frigoritolerans]